MKKTLLSIVCILVAVSLSAQLQHKLVRFYDNYDLECNEFIYNQEHRLIAVHQVVTGMDGYDCYDSISYDSNGDIVKICGWQLLDGEFKFVNYVDYTYDENHHITSRTNYNLFDSNWELGGIYVYSYDEQGHLVHTELTMMNTVVQEIDYRYEGDLLQEEIWTDDFGYEVSVEKMTYYYDENNRLVNMQDSTYEDDMYILSGSESYTYDEMGNRICRKSFDQWGNQTERHEYTYSDMLKSETLMPYTPELVKPADTEGNTNVYTQEEFWALDVNYTLQHICDYTYQYVGINESPVDNVPVQQQVLDVKKVLIDGRIYIECGTEMYDLNGRRIR